jgi:hypothetical protein
MGPLASRIQTAYFAPASQQQEAFPVSKKTFVDPNSSGGRTFDKPEGADIDTEPRTPSQRDVSVGCASFAEQPTNGDDVEVADIPAGDNKKKIEAACDPQLGQESIDAELPSGSEIDRDLQTVHAIADLIGQMMTLIMKNIDAWLAAEDRRLKYGYENVAISVHADKIRDHSVALADRIANLGKPSNGRVLLTSGGVRILAPEQISETKNAYDVAKLNKLDERDIRDAIEFNTELKDMFGLGWIDEEIGVPLRDALHLLCELLEDGVAIVPGTVVRVLKVLLKGHPRGFSRYYTGTDPWPRPSAEVQEGRNRRPDA